MKILAIRGKNLASLAGEFSIDFREQPLASAGLFAICGPTGAGKSTLLDALCLALYDKTPRLQQAGGKGVYLRDVGDETLPPHDARNLLRRGCADGYAEVEFIGNDRQHYRSRWSVRRARGRADRKLQATEMQLSRLPEQQAIGGKKSEVQEAIVEKLGLNFDQFTRAVLLAQNEFSVFLKAPDDERASLLETLTGTDEYSRISIRAFDRAKLEKQKLDALQNQLAAQQPLPADERATLLDQAQALELNIAEVNRQKAAIDGHLLWHQRFQALHTDEQDAQTRVLQARDEHGQAQARRDYLSLVEALQAARPLLSDHDRLHDECRQLQRRLDADDTAAGLAEARQQTAHEQQIAAAQHLQAVEQRQVELETEIVKARALDAEINTLLPRRQQQQQGLTQAGRGLQALRDQHSETQRHLRQTEQTLSECSDWLAAHADLARLSEQWPRWDTLFMQGKTLCKQLADARSACSQSETELRLAQEAAQTAQAQFNALQPGVAEANRHCETAETQANPFDAETLTRRHGQHQHKLTKLRRAEAIWQALTRLTAERDGHNEALQRLYEQRRRHGDALDIVIGQLPTLVARHEQAATMLDLAKLASSKNVESLRARLQPDSECPVCGSKQHPFAGDAHPFRQELNLLESEVHSCLEQRKQAERQQSRLSLESEQLDQQAAETRTTLATLTAQLDEQQTAWDAQTELGDCLPLEIDQIGPWLGGQIGMEELALHAVTEELKAMSTALTARDQARQALAAVVEQQQALRQQLDRAKADLHNAERTRDNASDKQQTLANQLERQLDELDAAFDRSSWRQDWLIDEEGFHRRCLLQAQDWQTRQARREHASNQLAIRQTALAGLQSGIAQAETHLTAATEAFAAIDGELSDKQRQRQALLMGRAATDVEAESALSLKAAKTALQSAINAAHEAATQAASAREKVNQLRGMLAARQAQLADAEQQLSAWLRGFAAPLSLLELRRHLQHDADWLASERQALQRLEQALAQAQTVLDERRQQCEQHLQARTSMENPENLQAQRQKLSNGLEEFNRQLSEIKLRLRMDDERLQANAELHAQIAAQAAVNDTWAKLNSLIGSADGKQFRIIAQKLTLDILLGYANRHLKDLSRRYRLERIGGDTLSLQVVDQDMGDEIRSVHSLSGGESFLLSLALALGLASLSSNRVRVESLFIDEGFGSLDAETLRVAMDALDSLQALGRKVGVISHVREMTERIGTRIEVVRVGSGLSKVMIS